MQQTKKQGEKNARFKKEQSKVIIMRYKSLKSNKIKKMVKLSN